MENKDLLAGELLQDVGVVGTQIFGGYIDVDYQEKWRDLQTKIDTIDEMCGSDSTAEQIYNAVTSPLLSAYFYLTPSDESEEAVKIKEFIEENLKEINFQQFLENAVTYKKYGFSLFAENYKIDDGMIMWKEFKFLSQSSLHTWTDVARSPWVDGHPVAITQINFSYDELEKTGKSNFVTEVPWDRLIRFTNKQVGNNFEGRSIFRSAYSHWFYKQIAYKIVMIAIERFGAGIPVVEFKTGTTDKQKESFIKMLKSIRTNQQAYAIYETGNKLEILTPNGSGVQELAKSIIEHMDKKMYDSASCGFLNLTTGGKGSHALSKDQHQYFMETLESDADYILSVLNEKIEELVELNGWDSELAPTLNISDIGETDSESFVTSMATAKEKGLITYNQNDEDKVRSQLKLDPLEEDDETSYATTSPNAVETTTEDSADSSSIEDEIDVPETKMRRFSKKKINFASISVSKAEKIFLKDISDYENYIASEANIIEGIVQEYENKYKDVLRKLYASAETTIRDGVVIIVNSTENRKKRNEAIKKIKALTASLELKLIDSNIQERLFRNTVKMAVSSIDHNEENLSKWTDSVNDNKVNSFIDGYRSNILGVLFNEPRQIEENIILNFGSEVSQKLAETSVDTISFNKNILKLSSTTHARGAYNAIQYDINVERGFTFFKNLVPPSKIKDLDPSGMTASILYKIFTPAQFNQKMSEASGGKNTSAMTGMNIHHNGFIYFLPILSELLDKEEKISEEQRKELERIITEE